MINKSRYKIQANGDRSQFRVLCDRRTFFGLFPNWQPCWWISRFGTPSLNGFPTHKIVNSSQEVIITEDYFEAINIIDAHLNLLENTKLKTTWDDMV